MKLFIAAILICLVVLWAQPSGDPLIEDTLRVVDAVLKVNMPCGPCWSILLELVPTLPLKSLAMRRRCVSPIARRIESVMRSA